MLALTCWDWAVDARMASSAAPARWASSMDEHSAVLDAVQDASRRLRRCRWHPGQRLRAVLCGRQVGTKEWSRTAEQRNEAHVFADVFALLWLAS
jgi:hypothetical protein